jgi:flagellar protein FliS
MKKSAAAYAKNDTHTAVHSFGSGELIVLIYDRTLDHLKIARLSMENGGNGIEPFTKAHDLINQGLLACLDYDQGKDVAQNLKMIYEWSLKEILSARLSRSIAKVDNVVKILTELRDGWMQLLPEQTNQVELAKTN